MSVWERMRVWLTLVRVGMNGKGQLRGILRSQNRADSELIFRLHYLYFIILYFNSSSSSSSIQWPASSIKYPSFSLYFLPSLIYYLPNLYSVSSPSSITHNNFNSLSSSSIHYPPHPSTPDFLKCLLQCNNDTPLSFNYYSN